VFEGERIKINGLKTRSVYMFARRSEDELRGLLFHAGKSILKALGNLKTICIIINLILNLKMSVFADQQASISSF